MISNLWKKMNDPEYRRAFVASQINIGIPFQIRALLKSRPGWNQGTLAERTGMLQPRISGLMTPGRTRPNIETLRRVAEAFDCGLMVRFVPFSELTRWSEKFDPESFHVPSFDEDIYAERKGPQSEEAEQRMAMKTAVAGRIVPIDQAGAGAEHNLILKSPPQRHMKPFSGGANVDISLLASGSTEGSNDTWQHA
jgi:transcriptional regulator with XRE-family HTH domain